MPWLPDRNVDHSLRVHCHPCILAYPANGDLHHTEGSLDRGHAVCVRDGDRRASDEPTPADPYSLTNPWSAISPMDDDRQRSREKDIVLEGRPVFHPRASFAE